MTSRLRNLALAVVALTVPGAVPGAAQPTGGTVVGGTATIQGVGTPSVVVNQSSDRAIINWTTFNINTGGSATFNQPGSSSITLNRVTGGQGHSTIDGTITANGRVFIINRDGILIGRNAVINTAGFLASTHDIRNDDFMAGRMNFNISGRPDASIVNLGRITASSHGFAALVAPGVRNTGTITARLGTVALASGNGFTLDMYGDRLIQLAVGDEVAARVIDVATGRPLSSLVTNEGAIRASGGRVELTAAAARAVVDSVINNRGVIEANAVGRRNGKIVLGAATGRAGLPKQTVRVSGKITATGKGQARPSTYAGRGRSGGKGGTIQITGEDIQFAAAMLDVSGAAGGGKILVGGDYGGGRAIPGTVDNASAVLEGHAIPTATTVTVDGATTFNASATQRGQGGKVILWSDAVTSFAGTIYARGGEQGGDGGFVEVSGKRELAFTGRVNTLAPLGRAGTLLLDPDDYPIGAAEAATIVANLASTPVTIMTSASGTGGVGDIIVNSPITWSSANGLTFSAFRNVTVNANITNTSGRANVILRADNTGTGTGTVSFASLTQITTTGDVSIFYNPATYATPNDYAANVSGVASLTEYMLVNSAANLNAISSNPVGTYALGRDIDAAGFTFTSPAVAFDGLFDGQNKTISNITRPGYGLFDSNDGGTIRNLNFVNVNVSATGSSQTIGGLVRDNSGTISNVLVSGAVSGGSFTDITAGGLVGNNQGTVSNSGSAVSVTIANGSGAGGTGPVDQGFSALARAGGLAGLNSGTITSSSATGNVQGGGNTIIGGLVGWNDTGGAVSGSNAAGNVLTQTSSLHFAGISGGLVGRNTGAIASSYAAGDVSNLGPIRIVYIGGLIGQSQFNGSVTTSYASGDVVVNNSPGVVLDGSRAGGLVGDMENSSSITDSYALGNVTVSTSTPGYNLVAGGLVGWHFSGSVTNAYSTGAVSAASASQGVHALGGFVGMRNSGTIANGYWDQDTSGRGQAIGDDVGGTGGTATALTSSQARTQLSYVGFDFTNPSTQRWFMLDGRTRPFLRMENSTTIRNAHQLQMMAMDPAAAYTLANNIDLAPSLSNASEMWGPLGFASIASGGQFAGSFNGQGFTIANLTNAAASPGGLFASIGANASVRNLTLSNPAITATADNQSIGAVAGENSGLIENVRVLGGSVNGGSFQTINAGGLVGKNDIGGTITRSAAVAAVSVGSGLSTFNLAGGLVGLNFGSITESWASSNVTGGANFTVVGGLVGVNGNQLTSTAGTITDSYAVGHVVGATAGGLVGNHSLGTITRTGSAGRVLGTVTGGLAGAADGGTFVDSYWDTQTSGQASSAGTGATGLTTAQLQSGLPTGFGVGTWSNATGGSGIAYPYLTWQFNGATPQVISGTLFSDRSVTPEAGRFVFAVINGTSVASALTGGAVLTGANGYYYYLLAPGTIPTSNAQVLTYVNAIPGSVTIPAGVAFQHNAHLNNLANPFVTGLDIYRDYTHIRTPAASLNDTHLGLNNAQGSHNDANIAVFNTFRNNRQYDLTNSNFVIDAAIDLQFSTRTLVLNTGGTITQTSPISAGNLLLLGSGGTYQLTHVGNQIDNLAANTTAISLAGENDLAITTISGVSGVTAATLAISSDQTVTQTAPITATNLALIGSGGSFTLTNAGNAIGTLAADVGSTGSVSVTDNSGLVIGTVNPVGVTAGTFIVSSSGNVTQTAPIIAANLAATGGGNFAFDNLNNQVGTFAAQGGTVSLTDSGTLAIGAVGTTAGVQASQFTLVTAGSVTQTERINATRLDLLGATGTFTLNHANNQVTRLTAIASTVALTNTTDLTLNTAGGGGGIGFSVTRLDLANTGTVSQDASIVAGELLLRGNNTIYTLNNDGNQVGTLAGNVTGLGRINVASSAGIAIGTVAGTAGLAADSIILTSAGSVTQSQPITVNELALRGSGANYTLNHAGNAIGTLAADVPGTGTVRITDNSGLVLGVAAGTAGVSVDTLIVSSTGPVTQTTAINVNNLALIGNGGSFALDNGANAIGTLAADVGTGSVSITDHGGLVIGTVNPAGVTAETLVISSTGTVTQTAPINVANLALLGSGGTFTLTHSGNQIGTLAANTGTGTGSVSLVDQGDLTVGTVAGTVGVTTGSLTMQQIGSTVFATGPVNVGLFNLVAGDWVQVAAALPAFQATDFRLGASASFLRATGGDGTAGSPYSLTDIYGLQGIKGVLLGKAFTLANSIDASTAATWNGGAGFAPIGSVAAPFAGSLDGLGRTVSNLTIAPADTTTRAVGLFGAVGSGGTVSNLTLAAASVTANPNFSGPFSQLAGMLAGHNAGTIANVAVSGTVNAASPTDVIAGGGVGRNEGTVSNSSAAGSVSGGTNGITGGFVGLNTGSVTSSSATSAVSGGNAIGGFAGSNAGTIAGSQAKGAVQATGATTAAGGFVGASIGGITGASATGNVTVAGGIAGGFVGFNLGSIALSFATGNVTGGSLAILGGFAGGNAGTINQAYATGTVTGGDTSFAGGFVGLNVAFNFGFSPVLAASSAFAQGLAAASPIGVGTITQAYALGRVTVGHTAFAASFAALNFGGLDQVYGAGRVQGGTGSTLGGLIATNSLAGIVPDFGLGTIGATFPAGTATNAFWDMQTTGQTTSAGGTGMNTSVLAGGLPAGFDPAIWSHGSYPYLVNLGPQDTTPGEPVIPPVIDSTPSLPPPDHQINANPIQLANALGGRETVNTPQIVQQFLTQQQKGPPTGTGAPAAATRGPTQAIQGPAGPVQVPGPAPIRIDVGDNNRHFYLPPPGETRLLTNEVVIQLPCDVPQADLNAILKQHSLTVLGSQCLQTGGNAAYRMRHASSRQVADVIRALAAHRIIAAAQANYVYTLAETTVQAVTSEQGDPGQYVPEKLRLPAVHRLVRGNNVPIAVIDSEIDGAHPDLSGTISGRFDATGVDEPPHAHGTGMAGAIVSRQKLLGVAPGARILAIRAFSSRAASAESTTYNILKGIDWALENNVRIVNMSFAGPRDPSLERALKAAYDKGVILIAAAGNAGPRALPLFPAADPHVIAVTATDIEDRLFTGANRGAHLAIAAPGVDILVPAPAGEYQVTTGTSVATAHVSGVVALMLERNAKLTPADVRKILAASARRLGPTNQFGAGLVDPVRALELATPRSAAAPASPVRR